MLQAAVGFGHQSVNFLLHQVVKGQSAIDAVPCKEVGKGGKYTTSAQATLTSFQIFLGRQCQGGEAEGESIRPAHAVFLPDVGGKAESGCLLPQPGEGGPTFSLQAHQLRIAQDLLH